MVMNFNYDININFPIKKKRLDYIIGIINIQIKKTFK